MIDAASNTKEELETPIQARQRDNDKPLQAFFLAVCGQLGSLIALVMMALIGVVGTAMVEQPSVAARQLADGTAQLRDQVADFHVLGKQPPPTPKGLGRIKSGVA